MKILALNLPQFHEVEENNLWWGKGFTEWDNVRRARPVFPGHAQPQVPLGENYYNLSRKETIAWQHELAQKYGVHGFVYFHYWYEGRRLLNKPCEVLLSNQDISANYCLCWANHSWTRAWDGKEHYVLLEQTYGLEADWRAHLNNLMPYFKDPRYIRKDGKPVFLIYNPSAIPEINRMIAMWGDELRRAGLGGIYLVEYISSKNTAPSCDSQAVYEDEPMYTCRFNIGAVGKVRRVIAKKLLQTDYQDYDIIWSRLLRKNRTYEGRAIIQGAFPAWDNSPRRGKLGSTIIHGSTPDKFREYMTQLLHGVRRDASEDFLIINAWNEWGEGAILEPTEQWRYGYLEALRDAVNDTQDNLIAQR